MTRGIILSGGHGTRLKPLTDHTPKSLIEIHGLPILEHLINYMRYAGVSEISCISDMQKPVRPWLEEYEPKVRIVDQDAPIGTGQAVHLALTGLPLTGGLMVMLGDIIPSSIVMANAIKENPRCSMLGINESDDPTQCAVVETDKNGWYLDHKEKPAHPKSNRTISGVFYFKDEMGFFDLQGSLILNKIQSYRGEYDILDTVKQMFRKGESFKCVENTILDCGTFEGIERAEAYFARNANG